MLSKVNWKRVAISGVGVFAVTFVAVAAKLPDAVSAADWPAVKALALSAFFGGLGAVVEAAFHAVTRGFGDPTSK